MKMKQTLAAVAVLAVTAMGASAHATEFVKNGGFEIFNPLNPHAGTSHEFGNFGGQLLKDWTGDGYTFLFKPGEADTTGAIGQFGVMKLWGPGTGSANGLGVSPFGGNFVASDPVFQVKPTTLKQGISGLTVGKKYRLSFYYAGAQQVPYLGPTTEGWHVQFGAQTFDTVALNNASQGFTGWSLATTEFQATSTSQVLSFLATGGPVAALPPFSLIDGVSLTESVPEPATWAMMIMGFGAVGVAVRRRRAVSTAA